MRQRAIIPILVLIWYTMILLGCAGQSTQVRKVTKPIDKTAEQIVKIRELKGETGQTRAVVSPADERQLRIPF